MALSHSLAHRCTRWPPHFPTNFVLPVLADEPKMNIITGTECVCAMAWDGATVHLVRLSWIHALDRIALETPYCLVLTQV